MAEDSASLPNPFPGLRPFEPDEDKFFFGRDGQSDQLLRLLQRNRFVAVVGTSGSGKSSLVRAGMLVALRSGFMTEAGSSWRIAIMRPGADPIANLVTALNDRSVLGTGQIDIETHRRMLETTLRRSSVGLVEAAREAWLAAHENLLVVVDQFEEIFRLKAARAKNGGVDDDAAAFVKLLLEAGAQSEVPIYIAITMRSDFLGDCAEFRDLPEALNRAQYLIPRMTRDQRRQAIEGPIAVGGASIAPRLVQRLLNDVGDDPDQLPVLQHALMRTWEVWEKAGQQGHPIDFEQYDRIGTMANALSNHAGEAFDELDERGQRIATRLFQCLSEKEPGNRETRRPARLSEICAVAEVTQDEVVAVVDRFRTPGRTFLLPAAPEKLGPDSVIDIAHESLIRLWSRLRGWADEEAESAASYRRLAIDAALNESGRSALWRDPELELALEWKKKRQPNAAWANRYVPGGFAVAMDFLERSSRARELTTAAAKAVARRRTTAAALMLGLAAVILLCTGALYIAEGQANDALRAQSRFLARDAQTATGQGDATLGMQLALAALPTEIAAPDRPFVPEAEYALENATMNQKELKVFQGHGDRVNSVAFSPDGAQIVTASDDKTARLWDVKRDASLVNAETGAQIVLRHGGPVNSAAFSPDGKRIVTASDDMTARLWIAGTGAQIAVLKGHTDKVNSAAFSPDGKRIVTASDDMTAQLWDARTGTQIAVLKGHKDKVNWAAFSPDGKDVVTASTDKTACLWDALTGAPIVDKTGKPIMLKHDAWVYSAAFSRNSAEIVTASADRTVRLWDAKTGAQIYKFEGHVGPVYSAAFSPDGQRIVTASADQTVGLWNPYARKPVYTAFSPDGKRIVTTAADKTARPSNVTPDAPNPVYSAAFSPDGARIVTASQDKTARLCNARTGAPILDPKTGRPITFQQGDAIYSAAFSPDGKRIVTASTDKTARLWDALTGTPILDAKTRKPIIFQHDDLVRSAAFSPDGARIVTASFDKTAKLWDGRTGAPIVDPKTGKPIILKGHKDAVHSAVFSPDGTRIATASNDKTVRLWDGRTGAPIVDAKTGEPIILKGHEGVVNSVAFSPDGARIVTASTDKTVRLWDAKTGVPTAVLKGHGDTVWSAVFSPDGTQILTASDDATVRLWKLSPHCQVLIVEAHKRLPYEISDSERAEENLDTDNPALLMGLYTSLRPWIAWGLPQSGDRCE